MFQRYTENAIQDIFNAEEEAKVTRQSFIGTAHLLIGLIKNKNSMISRVLEEKGLTLKKVRKEVEKIVFEGTDYPEGKLPFSKECKSLLELSFKICSNKGFDIFDSEDILFGIINSKNSDAYEVLSNLEINTIDLLNEINLIKKKKYGSSNDRYYSSFERFDYKKEEYFNDSDNEDTINLNSDDDNLIKKLKIIGILDPQQLLENDIFYWWQKKYIEISKIEKGNQTELLIDLNNAREKLEIIDKEYLIDVLKKKGKDNNFLRVTENENISDPENDDIANWFSDSPDWLNKTSNNKSLKDYIELGSEKYDFGDFKEAIKDFNKAIKINPFIAEVLHMRGAAKDSLEDYEEAIKDYDQAILLDSTDADFFNSRAVAKGKLGFFEESIKDLEKALKIDPTNRTFLENRNSVQNSIDEEKREEVKKKQKDNQKSIDKDKESAKNWKLKGDILKPKIDDKEIKLKSLVEAIFCYTKAIEVDSKYKIKLIDREETFINRGICRYFKLDYKDAYEDFSKAISFRKKNSLAFLYRGEVQSKLNNYSGSKNDFESAFKLESNEDIFYKRGLTRLNIRKYQEAINDFDDAISLLPKYKDAYFLRGLTNMILGNYWNSITDYTKLIEFDPSNHDAYFKRGTAKYELWKSSGLQYYKQGVYEDFSKGYKLKPNYKNEEVKLRYESLKNIAREKKEIKKNKPNLWEKIEDYFSY